MASLDLFAGENNDVTRFSERAYLLHGYVERDANAILEQLREVIKQSPLRQFVTPGGGKMSVRTSSCGDFGWITDRKGYRYTDTDTITGEPWPAMPAELKELAETAAKECGFESFSPNACLINVYHPGAAMGLHQDKDESDFSQPIVSFSLGLPATFLWGGLKRGGSPHKITLQHGDVLVWGGPDRLRYHGVKKLADGQHPLTGNVRVNLTFRVR
ncbi:alpha-ketoglutarate-dependent dioxygenase AlkB [Idiomarina piscisalsi]|uniref:Alpha-ketoglutarate-dependent dioxygenase AlkB n=1 Tax=Idiomarina piscisalsi TaxID=1096243 RepID=A0ABM6LTC1_9GAMM|nr:DNA oxidative demethylase AlkB [Idiomarina piscisalsi]ASG65817.1 alpha-ketoglutarate-dependent dioxygenase AlkB [Idiomarina piscisalsi]